MKPVISFVALVLMGCASAERAGETYSNASLSRTNHEFINSVSHPVEEFDDPGKMFPYVFYNLPDESVIYPSEGFYYFETGIGGREVKGAFRFPVKHPEIVEFGYYDLNNYVRENEGNGGFVRLTSSSELKIDAPDPFTRHLTYGGKTKTFKFYRVGWKRPDSLHLPSEHEYVGTGMDESGIRFHIVENLKTPHLMFVLDESVTVPEVFKVLPNSKNRLIIGTRSGFVFLNDPDPSVRLLVGVNARNVRRNNYYDGPFDQLPDLYVDQTRMGQRLERSYPMYAGKIDRYGNFLSDPNDGSRVAVVPYTIYESEQELVNQLEACEARKLDVADRLVCMSIDIKNPASQVFFNSVKMSFNSGHSGHAPKSGSRSAIK